MSLDDRLLEVLRQVAPGTALRPGLERILRANTGALIVLGAPPQVEALFTGGFRIDVPCTAKPSSRAASTSHSESTPPPWPPTAGMSSERMAVGAESACTARTAGGLAQARCGSARPVSPGRQTRDHGGPQA